MTPRITNGHQVRTDNTKARLLAAAEEVFVRDGFESAQLAAIAKVAGRTKGSIYAHYKSKDDLFLALYEYRGRLEMARLLELLKGCKTREVALRRFRKFLLGFVADRTWPLLTLEFKLYSVRHPESRERWKHSHDLVRFAEGGLLRAKLYSKAGPSRQKRLETAMVAVAPILSAITLETYFEPKLLSEDRLRDLFSRIFDVLLEVV